MTRIDELTRRLTRLAANSDGDGRERADLERTFAMVVRQSLGKGVGAPHVVRWVQKTHERLAGAQPTVPPIHYTPQITRILLDRILERIRPGMVTRAQHWSESLQDC